MVAFLANCFVIGSMKRKLADEKYYAKVKHRLRRKGA